MKKKNNIKPLLNLILILVMLISCFSNSVLAEGNTISDVGAVITETHFRELPFDASKLNNPLGIKSHNGAAAAIMNDESYRLNKGDSYYVEYPSALNYFGKMLTVRVDVTLDKLPKGRSVIYIKNNRINVGWDDDTQGAKTKWKVTFIDPETNETCPVKVLLGILDPDESHYEFTNATNRLIAYKDGKSTNGVTEGGAINNYVLQNGGIYRLDPTTEEIINTETYTGTPGYYEDALFLIESNAASFEFESDTICSGSIDVPYIWSKKYVITYDPNNETIVGTATGEMKEQIAKEDNNTLNENKYEAKGYKFKGWTLESGKKDEIEYIDKDTLVLDETDFADKPVVRTLYAQWEPIEYELAYDKNAKDAVDLKGEMTNDIVTIGDNKTKNNKFVRKGYDFVGWSEEPGEKNKKYNDGADVPVTADDIENMPKEEEPVVKTLYAQWTLKKYRILYNKNAEDATGEMSTQEFDVVKNPDPDKWESVPEDDWKYERVGYDFDGYKIENKGDTYKDSKEFKDYLFNEKDQEVELYAQWEPWKYYIHYDGNGADNMNAMTTDTFDYFNNSMMSKKNAFSRDGYRFDGFRVEVNGGVKVVWSQEEFAEILKELGPGSSVTLKAMWVKLPVRFQAPVTGIK